MPNVLERMAARAPSTEGGCGVTPDKIYIAGGASVALFVAGFFLVGAHHEVRHRLRQRRRGGYLMKGD